MFSGRVGTPAVGASIVLVAVLLLITGVASEEIHARSSVNPTVQPGDPDAFEGRAADTPLAVWGKPDLCGDSLSRVSAVVHRDIASDKPHEHRRASGEKHQRVRRFVRSLMRLLVLEVFVN